METGYLLLLLLVGLLHASAQARDTDGCTHGERKKKDCNNCICTPKGDWVCTLMTCGEHKTPTRCTPGTTFLRKCNRCLCEDDGETATCTRMCPNK